MKYLITGGAGFIGSNYVRFLLNKYEDISVVVYDKLTYAGNLNNLKEVETDSRYTFVYGDIIDAKLLRDTVIANNIDTIIHFAAESHVDRSINSPFNFIQTNIIGTFTLLELLRINPQIRFHHISTDEVFGELSIDEPNSKFTEYSPYNPSSPYSASKASSDHLVRAYQRVYNLRTTISNCTNNYGPFCYPEKLIPLAITRAIHNEQIPLYGSGKQIRDWIHVEDHCHGIDLAVTNGEISRTYLFGGSGEKENIWVVKTILDILNKPYSLISHTGDRKGHDIRYAVDFSNTTSELGYMPSKSIEARLEETVKWYLENEPIWQPLKPIADKIAEEYLSLN